MCDVSVIIGWARPSLLKYWGGGTGPPGPPCSYSYDNYVPVHIHTLTHIDTTSYTCMHIHTHAHTHACTYTHMHIHTCAHTACTYTYICTYTCTRACTHAHTHACTHARMHAHTHTIHIVAALSCPRVRGVLG